MNTANLVMQIMDKAGIRAELLSLGGSGVVEKVQLETNKTLEQTSTTGQSKTTKPHLEFPPNSLW